MPPVIAGAAFAAGLRTEALATYERRYQGLAGGVVDACMARDLPSDKWQEKFFYYESAPYMKLWRRGETMSEGGFKGVQWAVVNYEFANSIQWHFADRSDDQTQSLVNRARDVGASAALLDELMLFDIINASASWDRLPAIPNAPDGNALYYSSTRFGHASGNQVTGTGVASAYTIRNDYYSAMARFASFQDTEGNLLLPPDVVDGAVTIFFDATLLGVFAEAFDQKLSSTYGTTAGAVAASNVVIDQKRKVRMVPTARISANSWYIFLDNAPVKPVFSLMREPLQDAIETMENAPNVRATGYERIRFWMRKGYGVNMPMATLKVYNA
jgi:hypothetical protein